nr:MAG TPA: hypothetical protein [Caudoviricetes sp.]
MRVFCTFPFITLTRFFITLTRFIHHFDTVSRMLAKFRRVSDSSLLHGSFITLTRFHTHFYMVL